MLHSSFADWTMRKINRLSELASIDTTENTFVLIDNIFDGYVYDEEVAKWRDSLGFKFVNLAKEKNVQVLITAKEDVIEKVCKYMNNKSNVFDQKHVIDVKNVQLTDSEKIDIFDNQISFANKELRIDKPAKNEKFRKEIVAAEGPIGFPLCAHLYACAEKNRRMGSNFFSHPMNYLRDLVKHAISEDQTHKTKTLLLLLYLPESCPKYPSSKTMNLLDEKMCQQTLETFLNENKEFDTSDLATQAKKLIPTILMQLQPGSFCFKHQTICNAVGNYFFVEHFEMAREAFPIETFVDQDFSTITEKQCSAICARLIREVVENGNVSKVFSCIALTESSFAHIFCLQLDAQFDKHGVSFIRQFFAATGTPSCQFKFPGTFWVSKNKCFHLAMLMTEMIRKKNIDTDLHFYASLFGDCCASDESLLKHANNTTLEDVENAKDAVLRCITCDGNNIFHIVAMTAKSDLHSCRSLKKLYADFQDRQPEMYSKANKREETPLTLTATIKSDSRILSILTFLEFDETCTNTKDIDGHYPIHNTALTLKSSIYNALFELEMTVRLCLFIVYGTNSDHQAEAKSLLDNQRFKHFYAMLEGKSEKQNEMASIIEQLLTEIKNEKTDTEEGDTEVPNPNKRINHSLFSMIQISVSFLVNAKFEI
ncbi:uncharacterized protein LOC125673611 [Ostrea edulis]|uniref:uncharacterized protein LOC125673611 n=1 Tax=Ostrea edulis TaxID=37623 RepID=UPI0024AED036|nr:uncharacterized protein LOC125673611 [Ostrea edulis]